MNTISLAVTKKVVSYLAENPDVRERQIAIKDVSPEIRSALDTATKDNRVSILLGVRINLVVGDTHAIWRSHNMDNLAEYDLLFDLLALRPDAHMLFTCELTPLWLATN
jgi:hypothetical protein